ncbi:MAG: hypothetical protein AAFP10_04325 [Pseudomonadota bacterium]
MTKDATFSPRIDIHKSMPFQVKVPNEALTHSFEKAKDPENLQSYSDAKSAIDDMWNNN